MPIKRFGPVVLSLAVLLMGATPASAHEDPTTTVVGEVRHLAVEHLDGSSLDLTLVVPEDGEAVRVRGEGIEAVASGAVVEVEVEDLRDDPFQATDPSAGATVTDVAVVAEPEPAAAAVPSPGSGLAAAVTGLREVAVLTGTIGTQVADAVTPATIAAEVTEQVAPYWSDSTGGVIGFHVGSQLDAGAFTGASVSGGCSDTFIHEVLDWSAEQAGMSPTVNRRRHTVLYTPHWGACGFAGVAEVADGGSSWINGGTTGRWVTIAHELGHTLTLGHSFSRPDCRPLGVVTDGSAEQCHTGAYGDAYDVMGVVTNNVNAGPLSGAHLARLGLLTPDSAATATGPTLVTLAPVATLAGLCFLRFTSGGVTYHVEYRGAVGRDADLGETRRRAARKASTAAATRSSPRVSSSGESTRPRSTRTGPTRHAPPRRRLGRPRPGGRGAALRPAGGTHVPHGGRRPVGDGEEHRRDRCHDPARHRSARHHRGHRWPARAVRPDHHLG